MIITNKTILNDKQKTAYERAKYLSNMNYNYSLETNPSGRQFIKAALENKNTIVDVELCEWISDKNDEVRYKEQDDIIPIKLKEGKALIWVKDGTETGEDEKGWYYIENNEKIYRYIKV